MHIGKRSNSILMSLFVTTSLGLSACGAVEEGVAISVSKPSPMVVDVEPLTVELKKPFDIVTPQGLKSVTFGMTEVEANSVFLGGLQKPTYITESRETVKGCYYLYPKDVDYTVEHTFAFMVLAGTVQRIDIGSPDIATERGAKIGMSFEAIEALYPNAQRKPNFYTYPNQDLIVQLGNDTQAVFEHTDNEVVSHYHVGKTPAIEFVEGCQ